MTHVSIRGATEGDYEAVTSLLVANRLPADFAPAALSDFFVAESGGALAGVVGIEYHGSFGLVRSTAVAPEWRGQGLGKRLVERMIASAEARGVNALYLLTTTAERYFPSFGFVETTRHSVPAAIRQSTEFQVSCPMSAVVMRRERAD